MIARLTTGGVLSTLTLSVPVPTRPASFVQLPVNSMLVVSPFWAWSGVHVIGLPIVSAPAVCTVTSLVYQPLAPAVPVAVSVTTGADLTSFTISGVASVVRPASFVHEPFSVAPAVSVLTICAGVHTTGELMLSEPLVVTVTSLVYQPFDPTVPSVTASSALGGGWSSLIVTEAAAVPP